ncbi:hypothetical protein ABW20_dc0104104 [Dactylellina cionopaga]|nr:hypothetical protein ABW20_dc0104104 [Dactylellina cionopaga]
MYIFRFLFLQSFFLILTIPISHAVPTPPLKEVDSVENIKNGPDTTIKEPIKRNSPQIIENFFLPDSTATPVPAPAPTSKNPNHRRTVSPEFFYTGPLLVVCYDTVSVYNGVFNNAPGNNLPLKSIEWQHLYPPSDPRSRQSGLADIERTHQRCKDCICSPQGKMLPSEQGGCAREYSHQKYADICTNLLGCYCHTVLGQPEYNPEIPVDQYQHAINQLTAVVRLGNQGWYWNNGPRDANGNQLTFGLFGPPIYNAPAPAPIRYDPDQDAPSEQDHEYAARHRVRVPGTNPPYYLEGQNERNNFGYIRGLGGGSFSGFFKRDIKENGHDLGENEGEGSSQNQDDSQCQKGAEKVKGEANGYTNH